MKQFVINRGSTLPYLEIEPINDGRNDFGKLCLALQAADAYFTMWDAKTGAKKIANARAHITSVDDGYGCADKMKVQYRWNKRDTDLPGMYTGKFLLRFEHDVAVEGMTFPKGDLLVPMQDELVIVVNGSGNGI